MRHVRAAGFAAGLVATVAVVAMAPHRVAAQSPAPPSVVCQDEPEFRQFDFWVGSWDVYDRATGDRAGTNRIEPLHGGCLLVEHWTSVGGGGGTSINYYDSVKGIWTQRWVSLNYAIEMEGGLDDAGRMVLVGELHNYRTREAIPFRGTWTPEDDGSVRQRFEQQDPASGAWMVWFDGRYEPRDP